MKSTGIVRHVDNLDRIVIPKELCRTLDIQPKSPLEIYIEDARIVLKKHDPSEYSGKKRGSLGIIRHVDGLDRIVIPKEICKMLSIEPKDALEIFVEDTKLILGKYEPACIFCGEVHNVCTYKRKLVCEKCIEAMSNLI